ncbi:secretin receptor [Acomys russatus]|uniref:secretin receptor n=1 Tax=Acomys russatus TaxID=60746 RepID=UPI0021E1C143|nr:secretin receptor [Acomys russatus]
MASKRVLDTVQDAERDTEIDNELLPRSQNAKADNSRWSMPGTTSPWLSPWKPRSPLLLRLLLLASTVHTALEQWSRSSGPVLPQAGIVGRRRAWWAGRADLRLSLQHAYLLKLKVMYTVGYSSSLAMLLVALSVLCSFRRLHCTRNYIHMHLFVSFILRALSNFIKDAVLFPSDDVTYCDAHRAGCKLVMLFFQYCIMANYAWLLVEGLYLHTLLAISFFSERKCLQAFVLLGWGSPAIFVASWAITRHFLEDTGCWDINANTSIWWVIRGPVILSILINFIFFINILRILMRKLRTQETRGNETSHYRRLAKSTLLLIPLFGIHYIVFAFSPEDAMEVQLFFELALGSFQGLVVAVLYCFLNGEVQLEIQKKWRQWHLQEFPLRPVALSNSFSNATSGPSHSTKASTSEHSRSTPRASVL